MKTLKGGKFTIEVDPSNTVAEIKTVIENTKSELPAEGMKLIHSGKVLKDDEKIESCNIKPNDFLVVMIAKTKKVASKPAASAPKTPATTSGNPPTPAAPAHSSSSGGTATASAAASAAPASSAAATTSPAAASSSSSDEFPAEVVNNLKALGFPDGMVIACLRASNGNPDVAVEFLMNGIPPGIGDSGSASAAASSDASSSVGASSGNGLDALRSHPQFDALRRLVQSNPSSLQAVLAQIGQQQPELLQAINANQAAFLEMMNEPVADAPAAPAAPANAASSSGGAGGPFSGLPGMDMNPAALAGMLQQMPPADQAAMAQMMGVDVAQLQQIAQMIGAMPPEQLAQFSQMASAGMGGMPGMPSGAGAGAGGGGGPQVLRLSEEEMAAVNRLTEMGFDRTEAAQAYLACDKNEALAANLLMDGGFGGAFDDDQDDGGNGDNNDDMYD